MRSAELPARPALIAAVIALAIITPSALAQPNEEDAAALAEVMLTRLNEARADSGLPPYRVNAALEQAAFAHAREIAEHAHYSHTSLDGRSAEDRARQAGYGAGRSGVRIGENFVGRQHLDDAFQWLMDDPPHRANMLHPEYREVGVGAAPISYGYIWVIDFGTYDGIDAALAAPQATDAPPTATIAPSPIPTETPQPSATASAMPSATLAPPTATVAPPTAVETTSAATAVGQTAATALATDVASDGSGAAATTDAETEGAPGAGPSRMWRWISLGSLLVALAAIGLLAVRRRR